jgi:hypothetical protein
VPKELLRQEGGGMNRNQLHSAAFMFAAIIACALIFALNGGAQ